MSNGRNGSTKGLQAKTLEKDELGRVALTDYIRSDEDGCTM
jgi:hypothetical protein